MDETSLIENVNRYLVDKHLQNVSRDWIGRQISSLTPSERNNAPNVIYKRILECDWKMNEKFSQLPAGLDKMLLNQTKLVFNGNFVLQISGIVDISRPIPKNEFDEEIEEEDNDDDDQVSESELAKLMRGKSLPAKKKENRFHTNGKRCLQMALFDGENECVALEYSPMPHLHDNLLGAKVLLTGPLEVYAGVIFLRPNQIELLSDLTFYPPPVAEAPAQANPPQTADNENNPVEWFIDER